MSWSYGKNPAYDVKDYIRYHIGDTIEARALLEDEEIMSSYEACNGSKEAAVADCLQALMTRFATEVDYSIGPEKVAAGARFNHYRALYNSWAVKMRSASFPLGDPEAMSRPPIFTIGMQDNRE